MPMKKSIIVFVLTSLLVWPGLAQEKLLRKSWIKSSIEQLNRKATEPDTNYLRYTFENTVVLYGFEPGWNSMQMPFSIKGKTLTLGFDHWTIETLTDSTLTIFLNGFRRMHFVAETHLQNNERSLVEIGEHNGKPLYKANRSITPRYMKPNALADDILKQDRSDDYNIRTAGIFMMSFIVDEKGKIQAPQVIRSVAEGYDKNVIRELIKTSKHWKPAIFRGQPVQTRVIFEVQFLDSFKR
jgi:hypothetical protein